jgi:hypothetical protein
MGRINPFNWTPEETIMSDKKSVIYLLMFIVSICSSVSAEETIKPFVLAAIHETGEVSEIASSTKNKLIQGGFEVVGQYSPYEDAEILVFTSKTLREKSVLSPRGGYSAVLRASVTSNNGKIELAFTNPTYWANAYRLSDNLGDTKKQLENILGSLEEFGSGDLNLTASDMRKYHYTFMMEYFDDPSILAFSDTHAQAVEIVNTNLSEGVAATQKVYQLDLGKDSNGKAMTLIGVGLKGQDEDDCSSDAYIMGKIDRSSPRHTAHLPYEVLVYGQQVEALFGRFRIAISWPHLPMMASETGATFLSIMCAPGSIEDALTEVAGGASEVKSNEK